MRVGADLEAAQKTASMEPVYKVVLSHASPPGTQETEYTYYKDNLNPAGNILLEILDHHEDPYDQHATLVLDNSDNGLADFDFTGYTADIYYGAAGVAPELATNSGGISQTDWVDTNGDGVADSWVEAPAEDTAIVTGSEWSGNAQWFSSPKYYAQGVFQSIGWVNTTTYRVTFKYKTSSNALSGYIYSRASGGSIAWKETLPSTNGAVVSYSCEISPNSGHTQIMFAVSSNTGTAEMTIDEVSVTDADAAYIGGQCAQLKVYRPDSASSSRGVEVRLDCRGKDFDETYQQASDTLSNDTYTVRQWIDQIMGDSGTPISIFDHCPAYTVDVGTVDDAMSDYVPKRGFKIIKGASRLSARRRLIDLTGCILRWENDGNPHIFLPETSTVDYEYRVDVTNYHEFKIHRRRSSAVLPNDITVSSLASQTDSFSGNASVSDQYGVFKAFYSHYCSSNDEAKDLADAILVKSQLNRDVGYVHLTRINALQEVGDYVTVTDAWTGEAEHSGHVSTIKRNVYRSGHTDMTVMFGKWRTTDALERLRETHSDNYYGDITAENIDMNSMLDVTVDGTNYSMVLSAHLDAHKIKLSSQTIVDATGEVGGSYSLVEQTQITAGKITLSSESFLIDETKVASGVTGSHGSQFDTFGIRGWSGKVAIATIVGAGGTVTVTTTGVHGRSTGDVIAIDGTPSYDIGWAEITYIDTTRFSYPDPTNPIGIEYTGYVRLVQWACSNVDGALYAAKGGVKIDGLGITLTGSELLIFKDASTPSNGRGFMFGGTDSTLRIMASSGTDIFMYADTDVIISASGTVRPYNDSATDLGTNTIRFAKAYCDTYYGDGSNLTLNAQSAPYDWATSHNMAGGDLINLAGLNTLLNLYGGHWNSLIDKLQAAGVLTP